MRRTYRDGRIDVRLRVDDLSTTLARLREAGARVRTEIAAGVAVDTALLVDPAGNPVARSGYHERASRSSGPRARNEPLTTTEEEEQ